MCAVEWKKIKDICKVIAPPTKIESSSYSEIGMYPIIDQGQKNIVGYTNDEGTLLAENEYVLFGDHTRYVKYYNGRFAQGADGLKILVTKNDINTKYFFYTFANIDIPSRGYSRHWSIAKELEIPIPSLAKQQEIVSHLDTFTTLISNLESELDMRRKQYEHYRNQLLDFEGVEGVEWKTLGDVCDLKNGYTPSTKNPDFWDNGHLPWFTLEDIRKNGNILYDAIKHITPLGIKRNGLFPKDSIIVSTTATIGEYALVCVDFMCNQQITCISISEACKNLVLVKYLYHLGYKIGDWCRNNVNGGGGLSIVSTSKLKQYSFPIPSLAKQQEIVEKLDAFENLIQSLEQEIKLRKGQYEYYREKLLTFE